MEIKKAIEILENHNKWRRDDTGQYTMAHPKDLGMAIDTVVNEFKTQLASKNELILQLIEKIETEKGNQIKEYENTMLCGRGKITITITID